MNLGKFFFTAEATIKPMMAFRTKLLGGFSMGKVVETASCTSNMHPIESNDGSSEARST